MADTTTAPSALAQQLHWAMNAARKSQDKDRTLVLGTIIANLKNRRIELRREPISESGRWRYLDLVLHDPPLVTILIRPMHELDPILFGGHDRHFGIERFKEGTPL